MNGGFPDLFIRRTWGSVTIDFHLDLMPLDELISNVNIVPFCGNGLVVLRLENGRYEMPGGTREPNEAWLDTLRRELVEEAGAELTSFTHIGAWQWTTAAGEPYRSHLPHPIAYRVVGYGEVAITGEPTNPADGEQVATVEVLSLADAVARFLAGNRPDLADLYRLADQIRRGR
jgi:8-oxo-dGTP pyrophosphatase MutT (NUDIX family)